MNLQLVRVKQRIGDDVERRTSRRYSLRLPVLFRWRRESGEECRSGGFTRDVSTTGTYVNCENECPPQAAVVGIELLLPPGELQAAGLKLKAEGSVVRAGRAGEGTGFAVKTDFTADEERFAR